VLLMIFGLKQIATHGFESLSVACILGGLAVGAVFARRQLTLADPLIDLSLFKNRAFSAALVTYMMGAVVMFGAFVFIYQYMQLVLAQSPLEAGLWAMPMAIGFIVGSNISPFIVRRFKGWKVMAVGMATAGVALAMLTQVGGDGLLLIEVAMIIIAFGFSPVFTLATDMMIGAAPPERAGAASAIAETNAEFGGAVGIALLGSLGTALYRAEVTERMPEGVPSERLEEIRSTLGGAHTAAAEIGSPLGDQVLDVARMAFVDSIELTFAICAALALATSVLVAMMLRNVTPASHEDGIVEMPAERELAGAGVD
jgi:DHA2 family multidrug resistance protein-like MFS transporter